MARCSSTAWGSTSLARVEPWINLTPQIGKPGKYVNLGGQFQNVCFGYDPIWHILFKHAECHIICWWLKCTIVSCALKSWIDEVSMVTGPVSDSCLCKLIFLVFQRLIFGEGDLQNHPYKFRFHAGMNEGFSHVWQTARNQEVVQVLPKPCLCCCSNNFQLINLHRWWMSFSLICSFERFFERTFTNGWQINLKLLQVLYFVFQVPIFSFWFPNFRILFPTVRLPRLEPELVFPRCWRPKWKKPYVRGEVRFHTWKVATYC